MGLGRFAKASRPEEHFPALAAKDQGDADDIQNKADEEPVPSREPLLNRNIGGHTAGEQTEDDPGCQVQNRRAVRRSIGNRR